MTQCKSKKLLKTIIIAALLTYPVANAIPNDFEIAIAQQRLDGKLSLKDKAAMKTDSHDLLEPIKTSMDIYMAHEDIRLVSHDKGDREKVVKANEFVATVAGTKLAPDTKTTITNTDQLVQIPEKDKRNFKINVSGTYNGKTVKVFKSPNEKSEITSAFVVPMNIVSDDFTVYNSHYIKVRDESGHAWYVDMNQANWKVTTDNNKYRITGGPGNYHITDKPKNVTMDLTTPTNLTSDEIESLLAGTALAGIGDAVVEVEERYGINALFTISLAMLESGHGESYLARNRNNLFGICAYDSNVDAASSFATKSDCVRYWGKLIHDEYFAYGRTTLESINAIYASSGSWAYKVGNLMSRNASMIQ